MASGKFAKGQCQRCGFVVQLDELVEDGETRMLVCPDCQDIEHPAEEPFDASDDPALPRPSPIRDEAAVEANSLVHAMGWGSESYFGGQLETQDYADFPSVLHYFPCTEAATDTTWTDVVGGCQFTGMTFTSRYRYAVSLTASLARVPNVGSILLDQTKTTVILAAGRQRALYKFVSITDNAGSIGGLTLVAGTSGSYISYPSTRYLSAMSLAATRHATALVYTPGTQLAQYSVRPITGGFTLTDQTLSLADPAWPCDGVPMRLSIESGASIDTSFYGWAVLQFSSTPTEEFIQDMLEWTYPAWSTGDKRLYPGLEGVA